jgi:hypothetical protein
MYWLCEAIAGSEVGGHAHSDKRRLEPNRRLIAARGGTAGARSRVGAGNTGAPMSGRSLIGNGCRIPVRKNLYNLRMFGANMLVLGDSVGVSPMRSLERRLAAFTDSTANLIAQLRELDRLRERVRKAELTRRSPQVDRRKRTRIRRP